MNFFLLSKFERSYQLNIYLHKEIENQELEDDQQLRILLSELANFGHIWIYRLTDRKPESEEKDPQNFYSMNQLFLDNFLQAEHFLHTLDSSSEGIENQPVIHTLYYILEHSSFLRGRIVQRINELHGTLPNLQMIQFS